MMRKDDGDTDGSMRNGRRWLRRAHGQPPVVALILKANWGSLYMAAKHRRAKPHYEVDMAVQAWDLAKARAAIRSGSVSGEVCSEPSKLAREAFVGWLRTASWA